MTLAQPDDTAERMRLRDLVADRAEALGHPLAALMGHEWRIQADYLSARFDVVEPRLPPSSGSPADPLCRWPNGTCTVCTRPGRF
jgi:hypothetical protein